MSNSEPDEPDEAELLRRLEEELDPANQAAAEMEREMTGRESLSRLRAVVEVMMEAVERGSRDDALVFIAACREVQQAGQTFVEDENIDTLFGGNPFDGHPPVIVTDGSGESKMMIHRGDALRIIEAQIAYETGVREKWEHAENWGPWGELERGRMRAVMLEGYGLEDE